MTAWRTASVVKSTTRLLMNRKVSTETDDEVELDFETPCTDL